MKTDLHCMSCLTVIHWLLADDLTHRYHAEPSGTFYRYDAKAIGSGSEGAQAELVNEYHKYAALSIVKHAQTNCDTDP